MDDKKEQFIQEMQLIEQNIQNIMMQKQAFNMELTETKSARAQIEKSGDEVFKIIGQLMIKSDPASIKQELSEKEKMIDLRLKSLEKQESTLAERLDKLQKEVMKK